MKKKVLIIITIILAIVLVIGIMYAVDKYRMKHNKPVIFSTWGYSYCPPADVDEDGSYVFYATVIETYARSIIVEPVQGSVELRSSDKISVGVDDSTMYPLGTTVKITYNGLIMESYPAQINVKKIEIID